MQLMKQKIARDLIAQTAVHQAIDQAVMGVVVHHQVVMEALQAVVKQQLIK
jgi:hypothetical protein